jgi:hypothetical protein
MDKLSISASTDQPIFERGTLVITKTAVRYGTNSIPALDISSFTIQTRINFQPFTRDLRHPRFIWARFILFSAGILFLCFHQVIAAAAAFGAWSGFSSIRSTRVILCLRDHSRILLPWDSLLDYSSELYSALYLASKLNSNDHNEYFQH